VRTTNVAAGTAISDSGFKSHLAGTHRACPPQQTWEWIAQHLPAYGITRVADITGLDTIGIPVFLAVRPAAATLSVSQGKGITPILARVSAVMEAIELWHAENVTADITGMSTARLGTPPNTLELTYAVTELTELRWRHWHDDLPVDWIIGQGLVTGAAVPLPLACVRLDATYLPVWSPMLFAASSNGLASGNSVAEATVHALYEVVERDTAAELARLPAGDGTHLALDSVDDTDCRHLIDLFQRAGTQLRIRYHPGRTGTHLFEAHGSADNAPVRFAGWGCHTNPAIALARALTEAAQSRLTTIAGSRDDDEGLVRNRSATAGPPPLGPATGQVLHWPELDDRSGVTLHEDVGNLTAAITAATGREPIRFVLPSPTGVPVVKVIAPGLRFGGFRTAAGPAAGTEFG
jgi:ribosomal protein S12 methylthiotransferase accessory factor